MKIITHFVNGKPVELKDKVMRGGRGKSTGNPRCPDKECKMCRPDVSKKKDQD